MEDRSKVGRMHSKINLSLLKDWMLFSLLSCLTLNNAFHESLPPEFVFFISNSKFNIISNISQWVYVINFAFFAALESG